MKQEMKEEMETAYFSEWSPIEEVNNEEGRREVLR